MSISYFVYSSMKKKKVNKEIKNYIGELLLNGNKDDVKSFLQELKRINNR